MPDGRAIAYTDRDEKGVFGIFVQDFGPSRDTRSTRRRLGGFDNEARTESFGISPDGTRMIIGGTVEDSGLVMAEHVAGVSPPKRH